MPALTNEALMPVLDVLPKSAVTALEAGRIRVVVVDSHPLMRAGIRGVLGRMRDVAILSEGASAEDAVRLVESTRPDIVLLDIDTEGALTAVKTIGALSVHSRVIALTILSDDDVIVQALRAGASGVISKDSAEDDLASALRAIARGEIYMRPRTVSLLAANVRRRLPSSDERSARRKYDDLSDRERAVLDYVSTGLSGPEIGRLLHINAKTVDTYRHRIREKIGLLHRADYIRFALQIGLLKK